MRHYPVFLNVEDRKIVVCGGADAAIAKLRLLLKTRARIEVFSILPSGRIVDWENAGLLKVRRRDVHASDIQSNI